MCGSVRTYQVGHIDAFETYHDGEVTKTTIEGAHVAVVSVSHMVFHNTSELLQLGATKQIFRMKMLVLVMLEFLFQSQHLWAGTTSVNQELTEGQLVDFIQIILSGMVKAAVVAVAVAPSTILILH